MGMWKKRSERYYSIGWSEQRSTVADVPCADVLPVPVARGRPLARLCPICKTLAQASLSGIWRNVQVGNGDAERDVKWLFSLPNDTFNASLVSDLVLDVAAASAMLEPPLPSRVRLVQGTRGALGPLHRARTHGRGLVALQRREGGASQQIAFGSLARHTRFLFSLVVVRDVFWYNGCFSLDPTIKLKWALSVAAITDTPGRVICPLGPYLVPVTWPLRSVEVPAFFSKL
ncbi:hypothetical protein EI94DRAFT_1706984 [Lactarius quietus]|nr:hypothetical protein EI94DRAFT_1706984 [Lactarius quietus]